MNNKLGEFDAFVKRNLKWNFSVNVIDFALYTLALSFTSQLTILPAFVSKFTSSKILIGMIPTINVIGWLLPQLLSARYVEKFSRKKPFVLAVGLFERVPWLFMVLFIMPKSIPGMWKLASFMILYGVFCLAGGINTPAWLDMMGKIIPERTRGKFFGLSNFIGNGLGVIGALIAGYLLEKTAFPGNFSACFMVAFISTSISLVFVGLTREPEYPVVKCPSDLKSYLGELLNITRTNRNYFRFLIAMVIISMATMASGFFTVHAIDRLKLSGDDIGLFTAITLFFQTITNPLWGYLGDRKGHKIVMEASALFSVLSTLIAAFANSTYMFYVVFAVTGMSLSASVIARLSIVLEFSEPEERPTYIGLTNTIRAPFTAVAPLMGGLIGDMFNLPTVFIITSIIISIGLLIFITGVKEPRTQRIDL
ncbi:MFS transporter [Candidatus Poribacteria bacterium]|nr:MFS transporter [Candidatus Poribacteria bacterium]